MCHNVWESLVLKGGEDAALGRLRYYLPSRCTTGDVVFRFTKASRGAAEAQVRSSQSCLLARSSKLADASRPSLRFETDHVAKYFETRNGMLGPATGLY